jgi:hypothetical protein
MDNGKSGSGQRRMETTTDLVLKLPAPPQKPIASSPVLITEEQDVFARCEVAIENLKVAFWAAGKALEIIRDGRLYRAEHTSFDDYVDKRWAMSRGQADKLIRMWPIAQALFESMESESNDPTRIRVIRLNQAVIWELVPVAEGYDLEAATAVYKTTVEADEGPVTAEVVKGVVKGVAKTLTKGQEIDQEALTSAVRAALARVAARKEAGSRKSQVAAKPKTDPAPKLPWDSPDALNRMLRQHMSEENRRTLGKMLIND